MRVRRVAARRGAMLVMVAVTLVIFVVALVFSIDIAYMQLVRSQLRAAADAAAKAGALALCDEQSEQAAIQRAIEVAEKNLVAGQPLSLEASDIELGRPEVQPDGSWLFVPGGEPYGAVRVTANKSAGTKAGAARLFFGGLLGVQYFEPIHVATASQVDQDVVLVLDRSGSMAWDMSGVDGRYPTGGGRSYNECTPPHRRLSRWGAADAAVREFLVAVGQTNAIEQVSLVTFSSNTQACGRTIRAATVDSPLNPDYALVRRALNYYRRNPIPGGTNIGAGIDAAISVLTGANARRFARKTIIVMTDGQWTDGASPVEAAARASALNIRVHAITFSRSADEALMQDVASTAKGKHWHADDAQGLKDIYREIALTLPVMLTQ